MKQSSANIITQNVSYQMGLLHFAHLLMTSDGVIDERERSALEQIMEEENIPEIVFHDFQDNVVHKTEKQIYEDGVELLSGCTDQEKLCAIVHLFRLSEADNTIHEKEVRLLFYSLKGTDVDFEDVELTARLVKAAKKPIQMAVK
jgi:uncharacterized tellurite resistance protein B-like protein